MLEVEEYGAGPPLVLIHGSPANGKTWRAVGDLLSDRFRVIAPTLPDHEISPGSPPSEMKTAEMAKAIEHVIGHLDQPIRLAAHSFGSNVALAMALGERVTIERLVLFEPVTLKILPVVGEDAAFAYAKSAFDTYIDQHRRGESKAIETMIGFWFGPGAFDGLPPPVQDYLIERTDVNIRDVHCNFGEQYSPDLLKNIRVPTTIVYGGASPEILATIAKAIARALGNASTQMLDGATHAMLVTHPEYVAGAIAAQDPSEAT